MKLRSKVLSPGRHFLLLGLLLGLLFLRFSVAHTFAGRGSYKKLRLLVMQWFIVAHM